MQPLKGKSLLLVGLTLFSMFFGAGNLIFPPFLGVQAGSNTWIAMIGFLLSAVGFPILGVIAIAKAGGLSVLASRVHPKFAFVFTLLIYLSIGPCLAIPRTAGTSFEMAVVPFMAGGGTMQMTRIVYSAVFFVIALLLALRPDKLSDRLGKILTPCLLTLIAIIFLGCVFRPIGAYGMPMGIYGKTPLIQGFLDGYLTMDTIAALNFGIIIALNIQARGITEEHAIVKGTMKAGLIAGVILLLVYSALAHIGAMTGETFGAAENGARTLNQVVQFQFGSIGMVILAAIFFIACLNTCVGLLSCCSNYFESIIPSISYRSWVFLFAGASFVISNAGLNKILEISVPVLNILYPISIVLIVLGLLHPLIQKLPMIYPSAIILTGIVSIGSVLASLNPEI
ncbi:MAG: branched-chain amino acid transport system II carrier protein, partial [Hungatella sp.]